MSLPYIPGVETRLCNMDDHMYSMSSRPEIALTHRKQFVIAAAFKFGCTNCSLNSCETASNQHFNKTHDLFADSLAKRELLKELNHLQESLSEDDLTNCNKIVFICKKKKKKLWKIFHEWPTKYDYRRFLIAIDQKESTCLCRPMTFLCSMGMAGFAVLHQGFIQGL